MPCISSLDFSLASYECVNFNCVSSPPEVQLLLESRCALAWFCFCELGEPPAVPWRRKTPVEHAASALRCTGGRFRKVNLAALGHQPSQGLAQPTQIQLHNSHPREVLQCAFSVARHCRSLWSVTRHWNRQQNYKQEKRQRKHKKHKNTNTKVHRQNSTI